MFHEKWIRYQGSLTNEILSADLIKRKTDLEHFRQRQKYSICEKHKKRLSRLVKIDLKNCLENLLTIPLYLR
jgi:hypothetical protein